MGLAQAIPLSVQTLALLLVSKQAGFSVAQLKMAQEVIPPSVFVPFAVFYMNEPLRLDYLWAALCLMGAVNFIFRGA